MVLLAGKSERAHVPKVLPAPGEPPEVAVDVCDAEHNDVVLCARELAAGLAHLCVWVDQDPSALLLREVIAHERHDLRLGGLVHW